MIVFNLRTHFVEGMCKLKRSIIGLGEMMHYIISQVSKVTPHHAWVAGALKKGKTQTQMRWKHMNL